jgi:hypothetical protein
LSAVTTNIAGGPFPAGATLVYAGQLLDGTGAGIPAADLDAFTVTLSWLGSGNVINNVYRENVLNVGRGTVDDQGRYTITLQPAETTLNPAPLGTQKVMTIVIDWAYNTLSVIGRHQANLTLVALTEANPA